VKPIDGFDLDIDGMGTWIPGRQMMNCKEVVDELSDYLANELSQKDADRVRMHLDNAQTARPLWASLRQRSNGLTTSKRKILLHVLVNSVQFSWKSNIGAAASLRTEKKLVNILRSSTFTAISTCAMQRFKIVFLIFGLVLLAYAIKKSWGFAAIALPLLQMRGGFSPRLHPHSLPNG
jgi:hypothetical protein